MMMLLRFLWSISIELGLIQLFFFQNFLKASSYQKLGPIYCVFRKILKKFKKGKFFSGLVLTNVRINPAPRGKVKHDDMNQLR